MSLTVNHCLGIYYEYLMKGNDEMIDINLGKIVGLSCIEMALVG